MCVCESQIGRGSFGRGVFVGEWCVGEFDSQKNLEQNENSFGMVQNLAVHFDMLAIDPNDPPFFLGQNLIFGRCVGAARGTSDS